MTTRFRSRNSVVTTGKGVVLDQFIKPGLGCSGSPSWTPYYTDDSTRLYGHVEYMYDTPDNPPRRKLGTSGYRFNSMSRVVLDVPLGSGTGWMTRQKNQFCTGSGPYYAQYRRTERGLPLSMSASGLSIVDYNASQGFVDLTSYGIPWDKIGRLQGLVATSVMSKRGRGSDSNLWESAAEVNKTMAMVHDYMAKAKSIAKAAFSKKAALNLTNEAAGLYLMTRYGFAPTLNDIFHTLLALKETLGNRVERKRAEEYDEWSTITGGTLNDADTFLFTTTMFRNEKLTVRAVSVDEYVLSLLDSLGLGYKNLMTVPWELTKLSFVLDWFLNIGDFIGAIVPEPSLHHIGSCTSVLYESEWTWSAQPTGLTPGAASQVDVVSAPSAVSQTRKLTIKRRDTGLPAPSIRLKTDFKFDSILRAADATSLMVQQLLSSRSR